MGSRRRAHALASLLGLVAWHCSASRPARAEAPPLLAASLQYEAPVLVVPVALLLLEPAESTSLQLRQLGWTSRVDWTQLVTPDVAYLVSGELTPRYAHASNLVYSVGKPGVARAWSDTLLQLSAGYALGARSLLQSEWRLAIRKEWVTGLAARAQQAFWERPFGGLLASIRVGHVRSDEPQRARWDGIKAALDVRAWSDARHAWAQAQLRVGAGRKLGDWFVSGHALGFAITTDNLVARELIGGSWDGLEGWALHGHPYAAFRSQHGAAGHAAVDWELVRGFELGARCGGFVSPDEFAHGQALVLRALLGGIALTLGAATPNGEAFTGRPASLRVFGSVAAATLLP